MAFVVDGAEWHFDGKTVEQIEVALFRLLERMDTARARDEVVWFGDDLFSRPVLGSLDVWSLFDENAPVRLGQELSQALAAAFGRVGRYSEEDPWPPGFGEQDTVAVDAEPAAEKLDVAWAHHQIRNKRAVACLGLWRSGSHKTTSSLGDVSTWWVTDERTHRGFFRAAVDVERDTPTTLERLAPHAFPDLYFVADVWRGLSDFEGGYDRAREELRRHLAIYDDWGAWAFKGLSNQEIETRFAEKAAEVAPEKADVFRDRRKRRARERVVGGVTLYCEWHGKLERNCNRVYFHRPISASGDRLVVAVFHGHL